MKAVIMAGGEGTRLRPLTSYQPKPMLPLANKPMLEHVIDLLKAHGIEEIVITVAYLANAIRTYFGDGSEFGVRIAYATEETPLGTAGSVLNAAGELQERFLVISGDVLTDINLGQVIDFHTDKGALATIALKAMDNPLEFGIVITKPDGSIERFLEKPGWGQVFSDNVNTGIYLFEPEILDFIETGKAVDFAQDVFPVLLNKAKPLYGCSIDGYWSDVGALGPYMEAHRDVLEHKLEIAIPGFEVRPGVWLGQGSEVDPSVQLVPPVQIGAYAKVGAGSRLGAFTVLGAGVRVGKDCDIERSIVHDNAYLGQGVRLRGAIVGRSGDLRQGVVCEEGSVLGDECFVGKEAIINRDVKIYPFKTVEAGAQVNTSIIWESTGSRSIFGPLGVSGLANVDITPELATRVAMAYGTTLKRGSTVVTSRDSSRSARMLKRSIMAGLNASGINVDDLEVTTIPVQRFHTRSSGSQGGIAVHLDHDDPQSVVMRFFGEDGSDIDEGTRRKIERLYYREDYRRALAAEIGDIAFPPRILEFYTQALVDSVDVNEIRNNSFKLVLDYGYGACSFTMPNVLSKLGTDVMAINPYGSTVGIMTFDHQAHLERISELVRASGADLGAIIHPLGEQISIVDDKGVVLDRDMTMAVFCQLICERKPGSTIALPVSASGIVESICKKSGMARWSKLSSSETMRIANSGEVDYAIGHDGSIIFPQFISSFDGSATLVHLLSLMAHSSQPLSAIRTQIPEIHVVHQSAVTPFEQKGLVMRTLVEANQDKDLLLIDGIRIPVTGGWVLMVPDIQEPLTHIWAEGESKSMSEALCQTFTKRIQEIVSSN